MAATVCQLQGAQLTVAWRDNSSNESGFEIERALGSGSFSRLATVGANTTEYADNSVSEGKTYRYRIRAYNSLGKSAYTNIDSGTPLAVSGGATASGTTKVSLTSSDIGSPAPGSTTVSGGNYSISAAGADIWDRSDQFRFARQTVAGDSEITVRVSSLTRAHVWSKAGIMYRGSLAANAAHVSVLVTPDNGVALLWRSTNGGISSSIKLPDLKAPIWLRLMRDGNTFYAFYSENGTGWDLVDFVKVNLPSSVPAGLVVSSHHVNVRATATFENITID